MAEIIKLKLADNPHVQELFSILKENGKDTAGLTALLSYVNQMEGFVKSADNQISEMKSQLDEMKEIQKHPIKTALQNSSQYLKVQVAKIRIQLNKIYNGIANACKNAITGFKENGAIALDNLANFFNIKPFFEAINKNATAGIECCGKSVNKIESFSKEYHATSRHLKNMFRLIADKEPIETPKEIGKLAKAMCMPYKKQMGCLNSICSISDKATAKLGELGKNADEIRHGRQQGDKAPNIEERLIDAKEKADKAGQGVTGKSATIHEFKPKPEADGMVL